MHGWYRYFPWEDWRDGPSKLVARPILPRLRQWAAEASDAAMRRERTHRFEATFPGSERDWNEDLVLQRYELLYEAGLVPEASRRTSVVDPLPPGERMAFDHRRILATGIARLRAKIKYRPIVFELMPPSFTLLQLQRAVEALAGRRLHKQNFRRLIDQQGLVEEMAGMNQEEKEYMARFILDAREERGLTVLLIEHHMDVVSALCDRMSVLSYGEQIAEGTPGQALSDPKVVAAYLGSNKRHAA